MYVLNPTSPSSDLPLFLRISSLQQTLQSLGEKLGASSRYLRAPTHPYDGRGAPLPGKVLSGHSWGQGSGGVGALPEELGYLGAGEVPLAGPPARGGLGCPADQRHSPGLRVLWPAAPSRAGATHPQALPGRRVQPGRRGLVPSGLWRQVQSRELGPWRWRPRRHLPPCAPPDSLGEKRPQGDMLGCVSLHPPIPPFMTCCSIIFLGLLLGKPQDLIIHRQKRPIDDCPLESSKRVWEASPETGDTKGLEDRR
nr:uncharacterized protein LOC112427539 [Macaca nemestrina]